MARPRKTGLNYFPLDADFFTDSRIRVMKSKYGGDGISLYLYCLCEIYRSGYYRKADEDFCDCACADLSLSVERLAEMLEFFCRKGLLDSRLYNERGVLTSRGVQLRYQEACRSFRREVPVNASLWLLPPEETFPFIKTEGIASKQVEDNGFYSKNSTKESKENEIKVNESKANEIKANEIKANERKADESRAKPALAQENHIKKEEISAQDPQTAEATERLRKSSIERLLAADNDFFEECGTASAGNASFGRASAAASLKECTYSENAPVTTPRQELVQRYGEMNVQDYEQRFRSWASRQSHVRATMYPTIARWLEQDGVRTNSRRFTERQGNYDGCRSSIDSELILEELKRFYAPEDELDRSLWQVR